MNTRNAQKADQLIQQLVELPSQKKHAEQWLSQFSDRTDCGAINEYHKVVLKTTAEELGYQLIALIDANTPRSEAILVLEEMFKLQLLSEKMLVLETQKDICSEYPHHLWKDYSALKSEVNSALIKIQREVSGFKRLLMNKLVLILKDDVVDDDVVDDDVVAE